MDNNIFKDWNIIKWTFNILMLILTILIIGSFVNVTFAVGYILMLIIHELGHIMAALGYGVKVRFGGFTPFGAYIQILDQTTVKENAVIAMSGPISGLITTFICFFLYILIPNPSFLWISFFTGLVSFVNLIPLDPFDGGKVMQGVFCYFPLLFIPFLGYVAYLCFQEAIILSVLAIVLMLYIVRNVARMKRRNRIDMLLSFEKPPKLKIFMFYSISIVLLGCLLFVMFMYYGDSLFPNIQYVEWLSNM